MDSDRNNRRYFFNFKLYVLNLDLCPLPGGLYQPGEQCLQVAEIASNLSTLESHRLNLRSKDRDYSSEQMQVILICLIDWPSGQAFANRVWAYLNCASDCYVTDATRA